MTRSAFVFVSILFVACATAEPKVDAPAAAPAAPAPAAPIHLTLIGTNDTHGWVTPNSVEGEAKVGGSAALAAYVKILRDENPGGVILLDAGDLFQGTLVSNLSEGAVVIDAFNAIGYDAAAVGNHEFDYGPVGVHVTAAPGEDVFGALKARIAQAHFPLLSANIYEKATGLRPAWLPGDGTLIIERKGVKIGIVGLTTPQTPSTTLPINVESLRFAPLAPEAIAAAKSLRERGANLVIAVMHAGGKCTKWNDPHDTSSCDTDSGEVFQMLSQMPAGTLDAVVAGHSHAVIGHFFQATPVIESPGMGRFMGVIDLFVDPATRAVQPDATKISTLLPLRDAPGATFPAKPVVADAAVATLIAPALARVDELQHRKLGIDVPSAMHRNYEGESALGSFLSDSLRAEEKADVALLNPGGFRSDLKSGELTYGAVFEVMPFDNAIATLDVTGEELLKLLKAAYGGRKGVFAASGLDITLSKCVSPDRLKAATLAKGKAISPKAHYRVVMPDFLARGGDGLQSVMTTLEPAHIDLGQNRELNMRDALVTYWQAQKKALEAPKPGRVVLTNDAAPCGSSDGAERGQ